MRIVSFDAFRALGIPGSTYIKPEHMLTRLDLIRQADWLLFPEYWQVNSLYYGLKRRIFPGISSYHLGYDKVEMTRVLQLLCPGNLPRTVIYPDTPEYREQVLREFHFPFVAKVPRESQGRGVFLIETPGEWEAYQSAQGILYVQEYLELDRDLRVVIIGSDIVASYWRLQSYDGFHNNIAAGGGFDFSPPPQSALDLVTAVARRLRIDHAGFDVAVIEGKPYIFEFNRLFGHQGLVEQGIKVQELIYDYLLSRHSPGRSPSSGSSGRRARLKKAG